MARLIRLDIINGNPRTFVAPEGGLEQGLFLEIITYIFFKLNINMC